MPPGIALDVCLMTETRLAIGHATVDQRAGQGCLLSSLNEPPSRAVVGWLLDFALANQDAFVVTVRERHGPQGPARQAIEQVERDIIADMHRDLGAAGHLPSIAEDKLELVHKLIVQQTFQLCLACIEKPDRRDALLVEAQLVFAWCLTGAVVVSGQAG